MKFIFFPIVLLSFAMNVLAQKKYTDSINRFIRNYIRTHDAVKGDDKKYLRFFPVNERYRVTAHVVKPTSSQWFQMETSGKIKQTFRLYAVAHFTIHDTSLTLNIYQSQSLMDNPALKNYLFLPFTDLTTGNETYNTGRYIDFMTGDIKNEQLVIDFNKAYNPSCAYVSGVYNCPVPPRENSLPVAIAAGEKNYAKSH